MITKEQISRINELYRKQKSTGLTDKEKAEQSKLRRLYINSVKENLRGHLDSIKVVDNPQGECHDHGHHHHNCGCGKHHHRD